MRLKPLVSLTLLACGLAAAEPAAPARSDVRVLVGVEPAYEVTEKAKPSGGGASSTYDWKGTDTTSVAVGVQRVWEFGAQKPAGRALLGYEVIIHGNTIKPESYTSGGSTFSNADDESFDYVALSPALVLGWRFAQPENASVGFLGEIQGIVGPSVVSGRITNAYGSDISVGYGFDTGARVVLGIQESGWTGAVLAGVRRGVASITLNQDTYKSTMTLESMGAEVLVSVGCVF